MLSEKDVRAIGDAMTEALAPVLTVLAEIRDGRRTDATLTEAGRLLDPPTREPRPFRLSKVWPPDPISSYMPWRLETPDGWRGATRFTSADAAYRHIAAEGVRRYAELTHA